MVFVRYLWFTSGIMIVVGMSLVAAASIATWGAIALVCGLLLIWSGIVKIIVLRIWHKTLATPSGMNHRVE